MTLFDSWSFNAPFVGACNRGRYGKCGDVKRGAGCHVVGMMDVSSLHTEAPFIAEKKAWLSARKGKIYKAGSIDHHMSEQLLRYRSGDTALYDDIKLVAIWVWAPQRGSDDWDRYNLENTLLLKRLRDAGVSDASIFDEHNEAWHLSDLDDDEGGEDASGNDDDDEADNNSESKPKVTCSNCKASVLLHKLQAGARDGTLADARFEDADWVESLYDFHCLDCNDVARRRSKAGMAHDALIKITDY